MPLHDVWCVELAGGGPGRTILDVRALLSAEGLAEASAAVRFLFGLRRRLGRLFGWDRAPRRTTPESFLGRLTAEERAASLVEPGTPDGPFQTLYVSPRESISEVHNRTVHAFSVLALEARDGGYRLHFAIHVMPVGRITVWYMGLIDPFRRHLIYPALLGRLREAWATQPGDPRAAARGTDAG